MSDLLRHPATMRARKNHRCDLCGLRIPKGDTYMNSAHAHCGSVQTWKVHMHCDHLLNRLDISEEYPDGIDTGDFHDVVEEKYLELMEPHISGASDEGAVRGQLRNLGINMQMHFIIRAIAK